MMLRLRSYKMQQTELYFLRSSEAKIVKDMLPFAHDAKEQNIKLYTEFYGLKPTDLGLYALHLGEIAGAIWSREIEGKATLSVAVVKKFRNKSIGSQMMTQFLVEAGAVYEEIEVYVYNDDAKKFYAKFDFVYDDAKAMMLRKLEKKEIVRPTDGYDASHWMD